MSWSSSRRCLADVAEITAGNSASTEDARSKARTSTPGRSPTFSGWRATIVTAGGAGSSNRPSTTAVPMIPDPRTATRPAVPTAWAATAAMELWGEPGSSSRACRPTATAVSRARAKTPPTRPASSVLISVWRNWVRISCSPRMGDSRPAAIRYRWANARSPCRICGCASAARSPNIEWSVAPSSSSGPGTTTSTRRHVERTKQVSEGAAETSRPASSARTVPLCWG
jgi:hypothetical protein